MALKSKTFTLLGIIFCVACLIALVISFASDRWVVSTETEVEGFKNLGLWSACFDQYRPPPWSLVDRTYEGCWWILDKELDLLRHYLIPDWFTATQVLVTLGLVFELLCLISQIVNSINCFPHSRFRDKISLGLSLTSGILHGLTGVLLTVAVILFGARASSSRSWLEKPDQNYLSWSFGLCVLAAFLAFIAMLCQLLEFARLRLELGHGDEPSVYLTDQAPPESRYAYSPQKVPPRNSIRASDRKPAYASRYFNGAANSYKGSQGSLIEPRPPDTLFAVSGAGEVYINRFSDYDKDKGDGYGRAPERQYGRAGSTAGNHSIARGNARNLSSANGAPDTRYRVGPTQASDPNTNSERSKSNSHPVLPEYVPKKDKTYTTDEDDESEDDIPEKPGLDSSDSDKCDHKSHGANKKKSSSNSNRDRSSSHSKRKKSAKDSDHHHRRSKKSSGNKKSKKGEELRDSDEESTSHHHRRRSSSKSKSKHRSRSRDLNTSRDSYDSNTTGGRGRSGSRSRKRSRSRSRSHDRGLDSSKKSGRKSASGSREGRSKKGKGALSKDDYWSDELSGFESSSKRRSNRSRQEEKAGGKANRDYSDGESMRGRSTVKSNRSVPGDSKPKGTYSSYYEY
ncbi:claudin domain containing protein [Plakobranchus ocellatus]|uniref:Claudin domain containing protein n=1 Tax=Plakobranchus ocellatus TaxID=259542 RepID=A0AAV4CZS2_9GAST|nr:claudin domain containing protein [Plakobranchus ocellatus]